jgi:hypothetical protein
MARTSPIDELVEAIRADLHARRTATIERASRLNALIEQYVEAVEAELVGRFGAAHSIGGRRTAPAAPADAARALLDAVRSLPELANASQQAPTPASTGAPTGAAPATKPAPTPSSAPTPTESSDWPRLVTRTRSAPLVVVGGVAKPEKLAELPATLRGATEWIDTTRQGTHAIGNLERRIRDGRVGAVIVLEGLVSHRHSEPILGAARLADVPHARAGKGGRMALRRAVSELERSLERAGA